MTDSSTDHQQGEQAWGSRAADFRLPRLRRASLRGTEPKRCQVEARSAVALADEKAGRRTATVTSRIIEPDPCRINVRPCSVEITRPCTFPQLPHVNSAPSIIP